MQINWIHDAVVSVATICVNIVWIECICGENEFRNGVRFVCGTYMALTLIRSAIDCIHAFAG